MKIMILYYSKTGHTLEAVNAIAEGIKKAGSTVDLVAVNYFKPEKLADYDGLIVGSPCWAGSITSGGVAKPVTKALASIPADGLKGKRCAGVAVHAKMGGETTVNSLGKILAKKGCEDFKAGPSATAGTPFSIIKGASVSSDDEKIFQTFGVNFVA